ncbi:MAG: hypothetical protein MJY71_07985 [Bacteroidaceae bacterium]|nr:hypothetical protein [Bacteroidaceae bacterium]
MKEYEVWYNVNKIDLNSNEMQVARRQRMIIEAKDVWEAMDKAAQLAAIDIELESMDNEHFAYEVDDVSARERK